MSPLPARDRRICTSTGLALTSSPVDAQRIARESYGPLNPIPRASGAHPGPWSRYDTPGRTVYACADHLSAYMELLAPFRTEIGDERSALQSAADSMRIPLDEYWNAIVDEWDGGGSMRAQWLPSVFRDGRAVYALRFPQGWWIDITAIETISALHDLYPGTWPTADDVPVDHLTLAHLTGEDRVLTTAIAAAIRDDLVLDDGTLPLGIEFFSKHGHPSGGSGICWAYWMRDVDNGLDEPTVIAHSSPISARDPSFNAALAHCKIRTR